MVEIRGFEPINFDQKSPILLGFSCTFHISFHIFKKIRHLLVNGGSFILENVLVYSL